MSAIGKKHLVIPDTQVKPGVCISHFHWVARYAVDKWPDVVVMTGDHYDMPSLSSYDKAGSRAAEGARVCRDIDAGNRALEIMANHWAKEGFSPAMHVTLGNHEDRLFRAVRDNAKLDGVLGGHMFKFKEFGWKVHKFLKPVKIDGILYCHFFPHNSNGQVTQTRRGAPSARAQVLRVMCSSTAGHQQGLDVHIHPVPGGFQRGLIAGSFYTHNEEYMGPLNHYWRGVLLKHNVRNGNYNLCEVDLAFLKRKYG